jgi:hypothetical protein
MDTDPPTRLALIGFERGRRRLREYRPNHETGQGG